MKLSKQQVKEHQEAERLLAMDRLTYDDKCDVYEKWYPSYSSQIGVSGSFFTPFRLACDFSNLHVHGKRVIDLCAGIGLLSFLYYHRVRQWENFTPEVVCVELNPDFVRVGKTLFPEATWIQGDVMDEELIRSLGKFDYAIGNPPYGKIKTGGKNFWTRYKGNEFEYKVISVGQEIAKYGAFIIPPMSAPFQYSGQQTYRESKSEKYLKFEKETGIQLEFGVGVDTSMFKDEWKGTSIITEIVTCDFIKEEVLEAEIEECKPVVDNTEEVSTTHSKPEQLILFDERPF